jgi:hypothetical protein
MINFTGKALGNLRPNKPIYYNSEEPVDASKIVYESECDPITQQELDAEVIRLQAEYDALAYSRARQAEYPDWGTQLNKIYDDGLTKWKTEMVDPIKAKFPKP